ncbi:DUF3099 domain-containing protein [Arthrobacter roseus]|uniref:DUF3099 domain-containing protein n=1 Tax=Arthrobacter roseus TaxID=136274 RepID=UPI001965441F|nr:DUF3099 domain-containing protein [Arthrobacter roseus]MBM7848516.1 hypothetical protein [Arthrobacter roseus]
MSSYRDNGNDLPAITNVQEPHDVDMRRRMIKYSVSMGIRIVCILLVFVVTGWLQWVFIAGAVLLPYFAVVLANVGSDSERIPPSTFLLDRPPQRELGGRPHHPDDDAGDRTTAHEPYAGSTTLPGEIVPDEESTKPWTS